MLSALKFAGARSLFALALSLLFVSPSVAEAVSLEVASAQVSRDPRTDGPIIRVTLTDASKKIFGDFSKANVGNQIEVRHDGESLMKAVIREPITGGVIFIVNDQWLLAKVNDLASKLSKAGATVKVEPVSN